MTHNDVLFFGGEHFSTFVRRCELWWQDVSFFRFIQVFLFYFTSVAILPSVSVSFAGLLGL